MSDELLAYARAFVPAKDLAAFDAGDEEVYAKALSQWMTNPELADRIVKWAGISGYVLEPSCGLKALSNAATNAHADVTTVDIDPQFEPDICRNFLECEFNANFNWGLTNPPFEGGMDGKVLERLAFYSDEVVAIIRLAALSGSGRWEQLWQHVSVGGLIVLKNRPSFDLVRRKTGSPRHDFCIVKFSAYKVYETSKVEWW